MKGKAVCFYKRTWFLSLVLGSVLFLGACRQEQEGAQGAGIGGGQPQSIPAHVQKPDLREVREWSEFTGRFRAQQRVEIRARVSGYLEEIEFDDGQMVEKGDVLFVIDQRPYQIALEGAQARFDAAYNEFKRAQKLRESRAISEEDYDARRQAMRIAKADLNKAKLDMEFTEVKAPFTGRISNNRIDVGNLVNGDMTLLTTLVSTAPIEFYFEVTEADMLTYLRARRKGDAAQDVARDYPVYLRLQDEIDFVHEGKINFLDNELASDTATVQVRAVFDNESAIFEPGMFARVRIAHGDARERLLIPQKVVGAEQTRKYVYVLDKDNKAVRKYVTLGSLSDDGLQVVREGLEPDDRVVVGRLQMIQPGVEITPMDHPVSAQDGVQGNAGASKAGESK
ncbi:MAG: efflux RND transporter periplasmic adaptor subunit [Alphaproteobacteria bacterium]